MATKITRTLVDDMDGTEATRTATFSIEGIQYEIDLSDKNADKLRKALDPFVNAGRRVGGRVRNRGGESVTIRAWAKAQGLDVPDRGKIPAAVQEAYNAR